MRKINELIWHCTATPEGREVSVEEIDRWHRQRGWNGIGYHKVVHLDGSVSNGRPISKIGAHVRGNNTGTIGYVYVGGLDKNGNPKDTRTHAQKATMIRLSQEAMQEYGLRKISGHRDYAAKACPCFDAASEFRWITAGLPLKDPSSLSRSRTMKGATMGLAGGLGSSITEATDKISPFIEYSPWLKGLFILLTLAGVLVVAYSRWDDAGRPSTKEIFG